MSDSKTQNINVTKNTAFANMLGGYNGEKEYNKRNNPWTIDKDGNGKNEFNWSKARQTFGDLLGDVAMFGIGALSGGMDDPIRGIGQGFQNVYARRNAMNAAANNYENYLQQEAKEAEDRRLKELGKRQEMRTGAQSGMDYGFDFENEELSPYYDNRAAEKQWAQYQADSNTINDRNNLIGFKPPQGQEGQLTNTVQPQPIQTPGPGVELKIQEPGESEVLPNVQPVNYLQGGVNTTGYIPSPRKTLYNGTLAGSYNRDYINEQNNIRTNAQSDKNSQRSYAASMYGHNVSRQNTLDRIAFDREKQAEMLDLQKHAQELNEMKNAQNQFNNAIKMYQSAVDNGDKETANFYLQQANELSYYYPELSLGINAGYGSNPQTQGNKVKMKAPNGKIYAVDKDRVQEYIQAGGEVIQQ